MAAGGFNNGFDRVALSKIELNCNQQLTNTADIGSVLQGCIIEGKSNVASALVPSYCAVTFTGISIYPTA